MFKEAQHIHFIGIGGIGMAALAKWSLSQGKTVTGSDLHLSEITESVEHMGAKVFSGHTPSNIDSSTNLVVYSIAVPDDNIELTHARDRGIPVLSYAEALGELSKQFSTIVVTGTHGKSTTTAMLGLMLEAAGYDPTVLVGSLVPSFEHGNLRIGNGRFFVVEGCEYRANMTKMDPEMIVLTNIEEDHLDYYRDMDHVRETFQGFVDKLQGKGLVIVNAEDPESNNLSLSRSIAYGVDTDAEYMAKNRHTQNAEQRADVFRKENGDERIGELVLHVPGRFNVLNALAATAAAMELGVPFSTCAQVLKTFKGIWRRFERVGTWHEADVISDYGHHPTEVAATLKAAREFFPNRRLVLCYQPHQHSRTKEFLSDFVDVLKYADQLILAEIYDVAGRNEEHDVSSKEIAEQIGENAAYAENLSDAEEELRNLVQPKDVIIVMGAGDIDQLARNLV